ncbi:MAG: hypothetical protein JJT89_00985 [Nitriliruptoraceae bacterium]|nr:hypothetical protein [Nitriliruptoraceae bacterium]
MARILIVANQTLGGAPLDEAVQARIDTGEVEFFVLVPMTAMEHELAGAELGYWAGDVFLPPPPEVLQDSAGERLKVLEEARARAEERLQKMVGRIEELGGQVHGDVGASDPYVAARDVLDKQAFDEVLVSTLPRRLSRWLKMDLPSRLERCTDVPVTTVEAPELEPDEQG